MTEVRLLEVMLVQAFVLFGPMVYFEWRSHCRRVDRLESRLERLEGKQWERPVSIDRRSGTEG
jgi:hypothetical protein